VEDRCGVLGVDDDAEHLGPAHIQADRLHRPILP
jgi:hypothetical protein